MGRVFVLLGCSEEFARMALPVLMDGVISRHSQQPAATYACLAKTMAGKRLALSGLLFTPTLLIKWLVFTPTRALNIHSPTLSHSLSHGGSQRV